MQITNKRNRGFHLIEVVISLAIGVIGLVLPKAALNRFDNF